jgi:hypothetical protein
LTSTVLRSYLTITARRLNAPTDTAAQRGPVAQMDWAAIRAACAAEMWQRAYSAAGPCGGPDDAAWCEAAAYIEARKAEALAALVAAWKEARDAARPEL